jgi:DNA (cytosine-5)-methyltransferase 1
MIANTEPGAPMYEKYKQRIRLHPDQTSPTVVSGGIRPQFAYGHPTQARGLTIRERARLMSFPDWYEFLGGLTQGRVQTGDAVPPLLAKAVAGSIADSLAGKTAESDSDLDVVHVKTVKENLNPKTK